MSQTISRMYASHEQAVKAAEALRSSRFDRFEDVFVVVRSDEHGHIDAVTTAIMKTYVLKDHAKVYAEGVMRGGALVVVRASFGTGVPAMEILDDHGPIDSGLAEPEDRLPAWDDATPMSCALGLPVLLDDSATFSRFWNVPAISTHGATTCSVLGLPELSAPSASFNGTFGMALLSNKPTILSSMLGLPVLLKSRGG